MRVHKWYMWVQWEKLYTWKCGA